MKKKRNNEVTLRSLSNLIEHLASSTANGFARLEQDNAEIKENIKSTRQTILDVGDRFVPRFEFDNLLVRFNKLEQKVRGKAR